MGYGAPVPKPFAQPSPALPLAALLFLFACSEAPPRPGEDGGGGGGGGGGCSGCEVSCPPGFFALDGGAGCLALRPASACPAGTMPVLGSLDCAPVGVRACASGFVRDSSGWGCRDVIPDAPCTGATRERLGSTSCVPVGDCAAAFPPSGADFFVSAAYAPGQLDATHYASIAAAVAAADAGYLIAIDEGTYVGTVSPSRPVTLWGRCPEKVVLVPADGGTNVGLRLVDLPGVVVKNLTVRGFPGGVAIFGGSAELSGLVVEGNTIGGVIVSNGGATATLRDSVVRGQRARPADRQTSGVYVQKGAVLTLEDVALSDNEFVGGVTTNPDAGLVVRRSIIRGGFPIAQGPAVGSFGVGAYAVDGAWLQIEESAIVGNTTEGVLIARGGTRPGFGTVIRSTVRDTRRNLAFEDMARGIEAGKGSTLRVEGCTASGNAEHELIVTEGATATIVDTTTIGALDVGAPSGTGLLVGYDAGVVATSLAIVRPRAVGVEVEENGVLRLEGSLVAEPVLAAVPGSTTGVQAIAVSQKTKGALALVGSVLRRGLGVSLLLSTATATVERSLILDSSTRYGLGGRGISVQDGSTLTMTESAIVGAHETGVVTFDPGSRATILRSSIEDTAQDEFGNFGIAALATTGSTLELDACTVTRSASIGVAASEAAVALRSSFVSWNPTAVHAQDGASLRTSDAVTAAQNVLGVTTDTRFVGNGAISGVGAVPLPSK